MLDCGDSQNCSAQRRRCLFRVRFNRKAVGPTTHTGKGSRCKHGSQEEGSRRGDSDPRSVQFTSKGTFRPLAGVSMGVRFQGAGQMARHAPALAKPTLQNVLIVLATCLLGPAAGLAASSLSRSSWAGSDGRPEEPFEHMCDIHAHGSDLTARWSLKASGCCRLESWACPMSARARPSTCSPSSPFRPRTTPSVPSSPTPCVTTPAAVSTNPGNTKGPWPHGLGLMG